MTQNQINYVKLQEEKRHNLMTEAQTQQSLEQDKMLKESQVIANAAAANASNAAAYNYSTTAALNLQKTETEKFTTQTAEIGRQRASVEYNLAGAEAIMQYKRNDIELEVMNDPVGRWFMGVETAMGNYSSGVSRSLISGAASVAGALLK